MQPSHLGAIAEATLVGLGRRGRRNVFGGQIPTVRFMQAMRFRKCRTLQRGAMLKRMPLVLVGRGANAWNGHTSEPQCVAKMDTVALALYFDGCHWFRQDEGAKACNCYVVQPELDECR